ncbi:c-type cytochrome [Piscinibacter sakaiensis]|uniref:c-type cytochrome n=1 Tax=Piscinibacter sakaiensis TaxID=1547922 RepID=UPI003729952D
MFSCRDVAAAALVLAAAGSALAQAAAPSAGYAGIGRPATAKELQAWDIDVRPDFKGLPKGSGSVAKGMEVWEGKCASCHGIFGESNEVFSPLVGGTTKDDVRTGRVARLTDPGFPGRTTLMKVSSVSTLWDYINRAMPWNQPKSLTVEEVYAVTAYLLNLGGVLPDDYVMSDRNIAEVQQRLPNRNGVTTAHAMWPGAGLGRAARPDAAGVACMRDCATEPKVASILPDHARGAHGNLAEQNRLVLALAQKHACTACHGADNRIVGPGFKEIAGKYAGRSDAEAYLLGKIRAGGQGVWGQIPMPAQTLPEGDARALARWLAAGAAKP